MLFGIFGLKSQKDYLTTIVNCLRHARGDSQCCCDSRQDADGRLNHEFPEFFLFHVFSRLGV